MPVDRGALERMGDVGLKQAYDEHMAAVNAPRRPGTEPPFLGLDRSGFPDRPDLARFERRDGAARERADAGR